MTVYGNKCLDVTDGKNADGTKMQIWTCSTNNPNQKWDYNVRLHTYFKNGESCVMILILNSGVDEHDHLVQ